MTDILPPLLLSLRISIIATILTAAIGVPLAFLLARRNFPGKAMVETLLLVPLVLPPTVVGYIIMVMAVARSPVGLLLDRWFDFRILFSETGAVIAAMIVSLPLLLQPTKAAFATVEREMEDLARLMGAREPQIFWHVSLPMARRGILAGLLLAFARALGEFGATMMVFGNFAGRQTLPVRIYSDYEAGEMHRAFPAVVVLSVISLVIVFLYNRSTRQQ